MSLRLAINYLMLRKRYLRNIGLLAFLFFSLHCSGRIYVVTDTDDTTKVTSLRGAIREANHHGSPNTIILGQGIKSQQQPGQWIYHLTIRGADEAAGLKGDLNITR